MSNRLTREGKIGVTLLIGALMVAGATTAPAQEPLPPLPLAPPPVASPDQAPEVVAVAPGAAPAGREAELEARVRQLELMVKQLAAQKSQAPATGAAAGGASGAAAGGSSGSASGTGSGGASNTSGGGTGGNSPTSTPSRSGGPLAPGQSSPPNPPPSDRFRMPATTINSPLTGSFGPGFQLKTADDEFVAQWHNLTQFDGRFYQQGAQNPVRDTFVIPRQWWMLSGRITKPYEYFLSFQNTFDTINMLDVFLNIHYDDRLQFKLGRYKTPFTYEFYTEPIQGLIQPERSLFFNNFALNRALGMQAWGRLFNKTAPLDYAVGIFNGARNSYLDTSDAKTVLGYLNWRPFATLEDSPLENFVFGGSVMAGNQTNTPVPQTLRTAVATSGNSIVGVPFLSFNSNARESGPRAFWDLHAAWYYKQLSLIAEWQSGYDDYALNTNLAAHDRLAIQSYYVQAGYFLTGETVSGRNVVKPLRDFDIRKGKFGLGAIELTGRFNSLNISKNVFSAGLADPNLWTNNLYTTDLGFNWSLNQYVKLYFTWEHAVFGNSVQYNPTSMQKTSDLFLFRFQLYF